VNLKIVPRYASSFESLWLVGKSSTLRLGVERRRRLCAGTRRPLLCGKLRNEGGVKVTGTLGVSYSGRAFMASQKEPRKRLGDRKIILFVSVSTTWNRNGLVPTDTMG
jgi:hypothetical protein